MNNAWVPCPGCGFRIFYLVRSQVVYENGHYWHGRCWSFLSESIERTRAVVRELGPKRLRSPDWTGIEAES